MKILKTANYKKAQSNDNAAQLEKGWSVQGPVQCSNCYRWFDMNASLKACPHCNHVFTKSSSSKQNTKTLNYN
jgi:hypothetical protein